MRNATRGRGALILFLVPLIIAGGSPVLRAGRAAAQEANQLGVSGHDQTEYSKSTSDSLEILLEWFDLDATYGSFRGGLRYEAFQPPRVGDALGSAISGGFPYRYVETTQKIGTIRAGNYYALFGRGLTLNLFEDRDVRIDSNLDGAKYHGESHGFGLTALSGQARVTDNLRWPEDDLGTGVVDSVAIDRKDVVHAVDATYQPVPAFRLGGTLVGDRYPIVGQQDVLRDMHSVRGEAWLGPVAAYFEDARLHNRDDARHLPTGTGRYGSLTFSMPGVGLIAEARDYNHFDFHTQDGDIELNSPPSGTREQTYTLLNRHPHKLETDDERGYQLEADLTPRAGLSAVVNHSYTENHAGHPLYREANLELHDDDGFGRVGSLILAADYQQDVVTTTTRNYTLIGEGTVTLNDQLNARLEVGGQRVHDDRPIVRSGMLTTVGDFDDLLGVLEVSRAPGITGALTLEWDNKSAFQRSYYPDENRTTWAQASLAVQPVEGTDLELAYGARQAGYYCIGGRCRYEPAFTGFEVKLLSTF